MPRTLKNNDLLLNYFVGREAFSPVWSEGQVVQMGPGVSFPQLEELLSPQMCRPKPCINEEKQIVEVLYISGCFAPCDLQSRHKNT